MAHTSDVIVIGAGIAGASVAAEIAAGRNVTVLEMEDRPGHHTTGRSAATWIPGYGPEGVRALTRASGSFLQHPPPGFSEAPLTAPRGEMLLGLPGQEADVETYRQIGLRNISIADALTHVPLLRADELDSVLYDETCLDVDVDALHQSFLRRMKQLGGTLHCDAKVTALSRHDGTWRVEAGAHTYEAPVIINAAGAWADEIANLAGAEPVGLTPKRRSVAVIRPPDGADITNWPVTASAGETFYFKPQGGMLLVSPADVTPVDPHDAWADDMAIAEALHDLERFVDIEVTRIEHTWGGLRTFAPDGEPVVGFDPEVSGFFWLAGQGGYGIQTSPALSRTAAALIAGDDIPTDITAEGITAQALSPARFAA